MPNISLIGSPDQFQTPMFGGRPMVGGTASNIPSGSSSGDIQNQALKNLQMLEMMKRIREGSGKSSGFGKGASGMAPSANIGGAGAGAGTSVVPAGSIPGI